MGNGSEFVFRLKLLVEDGSVRRGVVMVKQPGLFSPKFGATSSHVFTQSPQNVAVELGFHRLAFWEKFFVHNLPGFKESYNRALDIAFHLSGLSWPWLRGAFPLGGLLLCLRVVTVNPVLISGDDPGQEGFIIEGELPKFSADVDALLLLVRILGRNLAATWCIHNYSVRTRWHVP